MKIKAELISAKGSLAWFFSMTVLWFNKTYQVPYKEWKGFRAYFAAHFQHSLEVHEYVRDETLVFGGKHNITKRLYDNLVEKQS
jgi:hypothetical protein